MANVTFGAGAVGQAGDGSATTQFEAAAFPRIVLLNAELSLTPAEARNGAVANLSTLRPTLQPEPQLVLPGVDGRPVAASIDRIQATAGIETNVRLRQESPGAPANLTAVDHPNIVRQAGPNRPPPTDVKPSRQFASPTPLRPSPGNADAKQLASQEPRASIASAGSAPANSRANLATSERKSTESTEKTAGDYSAFASRTSPLPGDDSSASDLLLKRSARSNPANHSPQPEDGREYLSGVQMIIFASAAIATALVLPGIVSEIRRRRKRPLPLISRPPRRSAHIGDELNDQVATLPIREKAG